MRNPFEASEESEVNHLDGYTVTDLADIEDLIHEYRNIRDGIKAAEAQLKEVRGRIEEAMGDYERGTLNGKPVVFWRSVESRRIDTAKLKDAMPDIYEEFSRVTVSKPFIVK